VKRVAFAIVLVVVGLAGRADAYPEFQLSRDQTCASCHIAPSGGGLLNENGMTTAETISHFGHRPEFFYNAIPTPSWLTLGGEIRTAYGYMKTPQAYLVGFPMQDDFYAAGKFADHFHVIATVGYRPGEWQNEAATHVWSREHYVMWQQNADTNEGLYVRLGRFMPVFGLRYAEHPMYERRFGGTALYTETYGVAVEYITPKYEIHGTGFIKDPLIDPVAHDNGGALYGEYRATEELQVGAEGMVTVSPDDKKYRGGVTAKYFVKGADLLVQGEGQIVNQHIGSFGLNQLMAQIMVTKFLPAGLMADFGIGHFDENLRINGLDRDAIDLNIHYFWDSHFEITLVTRLELINQGRTTGTDIGGPTGGYALLQLHYRL
jgi:hypothetical protein